MISIPLVGVRAEAFCTSEYHIAFRSSSLSRLSFAIRNSKVNSVQSSPLQSIIF
jgi:hypothetical protein